MTKLRLKSGSIIILIILVNMNDFKIVIGDYKVNL